MSGPIPYPACRVAAAPSRLHEQCRPDSCVLMTLPVALACRTCGGRVRRLRATRTTRCSTRHPASQWWAASQSAWTGRTWRCCAGSGECHTVCLLLRVCCRPGRVLFANHVRPGAYWHAAYWLLRVDCCVLGAVLTDAPSTRTRGHVPDSVAGGHGSDLHVGSSHTQRWHWAGLYCTPQVRGAEAPTVGVRQCCWCMFVCVRRTAAVLLPQLVPTLLQVLGDMEGGWHSLHAAAAQVWRLSHRQVWRGEAPRTPNRLVHNNQTPVAVN